MVPVDFQAHVERSIRDRERSKRFVKRVSWSIVALLVAMGLLLWLLPLARRTGHRTIGEVLEISFILGFFTLIGLVLLLRKRLAVQVDRLTADHDVLMEQNSRLEQQNTDLARQASTVRKQGAELRLAARRLDEAQRVAGLGYWEVDASTGETYWSDEMYRIAGLEAGVAPVSTRALIAAVHPDDRARAAAFVMRAADDPAEFNEQIRIGPANGPTRIVQATGRIIDSANGERKLVGTMADITLRATLELQLRRSQKMEALGQLAGGVAHDFNNMLTVIESYTGLLLADEVLGADARGDLEEIRAAARRAATLTRQLLAFSRQQVLQPRVLDVNEIIGDVEKMLRRLIDANIDFRMNLCSELDLVKADPTQIEQVLMNLVVNARDAMPTGGTLTIETDNVVLDASYTQRASAPRPGPYVMLAVSDTGSGIAQPVLDQIFEPFFTTKGVGRGTGLGLATVQGIVEQSGGHVWVYSEPSKGTTFKIYLPRAEAGEAELEPPTPISSTGGGSETILLVEDDEAVRVVAGTVLRRAGHRVLETTNGVDALRMAEETAPPIDLVISDMVMPEMGGRTLAEQLEQRLPNVPILLMSGYTRDALTGSLDLGPRVAFIEKPFSPEKLVAKVRDMLDHRERAHTPRDSVTSR